MNGSGSWALTEIIGPWPMVMGDPDPLRGALQNGGSEFGVRILCPGRDSLL